MNEENLTIVLAALALSRNFESKIGIRIKQFVKMIRSLRFGIVINSENEILAEQYVPENAKSILDKLL